MPAAGVRSNTPNDTPPEHPAIDPVKGVHRFKTNRMSSDLGIHKVSYTAQ